jgi:3-oxoadipate enol-lactonase
VTGSGPDVVLIHPGLWDMRTWDPQVPVLVDAGYRVLRYDVRGYGKSSRLVPGHKYSNVRDLLAVMDAASVERAALVGCSMGGGIALETAIAHPDRASALVLVATGPSGVDSTPEEEAWWEEREGPIQVAIAEGDLDRAEDLRLAIWAPLGVGDDGGRAIRQIAFDNIHEMTADESGQEGIDPSAAERLGEVEVPALLLPADHDPPEMLRLADILEEGIPSVRRVDIPDTDHVVNLRKPKEFNEELLRFLEEAARKPRSRAPAK